MIELKKTRHNVQVTFIIPYDGSLGKVSVVGDFNGDGVDDVGIFRAGRWYLDSNGNHELDAHDKVFEMGGASDLPVAGDWDGDGVDEPGTYRSGE